MSHKIVKGFYRGFQLSKLGKSRWQGEGDKTVVIRKLRREVTAGVDALLDSDRVIAVNEATKAAIIAECVSSAPVATVAPEATKVAAFTLSRVLGYLVVRFDTRPSEAVLSAFKAIAGTRFARTNGRDPRWGIEMARQGTAWGILCAQYAGATYLRPDGKEATVPTE